MYIIDTSFTCQEAVCSMPFTFLELASFLSASPTYRGLPLTTST